MYIINNKLYMHFNHRLFTIDCMHLILEFRSYYVGLFDVPLFFAGSVQSSGSCVSWQLKEKLTEWKFCNWEITTSFIVQQGLLHEHVTECKWLFCKQISFHSNSIDKKIFQKRKKWQGKPARPSSLEKSNRKLL
jgi:hypothetical protein